MSSDNFLSNSSNCFLTSSCGFTPGAGDGTQQIRAGSISLLYVSPERFNNERFVAALKGVKVALFVVDEAHCISEVNESFLVKRNMIPLAYYRLGHKHVLVLKEVNGC